MREGNVFNYAEVGGTLEAERIPAEYHRLRHRMHVGKGGEDFHTASVAVVEFRMHEAMRTRPVADRPYAQEGGHLTVHLGPKGFCFTAPCEVVWTVDEPRRKGFAYGTLVGHPERGEESFIVDWDADDQVWLTIESFSRPGSWYAKAAGPLVPVLQHVFVLSCGAVVRRLIARASAARDEV